MAPQGRRSAAKERIRREHFSTTFADGATTKTTTRGTSSGVSPTYDGDLNGHGRALNMTCPPLAPSGSPTAVASPSGAHDGIFGPFNEYRAVAGPTSKLNSSKKVRLSSDKSWIRSSSSGGGDTVATATATTATTEGDDTDDFEGGSNDENVSFGDAKSADLQVFVAPCRVTTPIGPESEGSVECILTPSKAAFSAQHQESSEAKQWRTMQPWQEVASSAGIEDPVLDPRRPYDEGVAVPTSPPRVTRSPMVSPTMMDEGDVSHLPSLELSPIRQTASASSENSDERANSQCLPHRTPAKKLPRSQENTPRMKNSSNFEVLNELLVHASIVAKDVPQGGKGAARKPAGLPMTPSKVSMSSPARPNRFSDGTAASPGRPPKSPGLPMHTKRMPSSPKCGSRLLPSPSSGSIESDGFHEGYEKSALNVSGDSLISWLAHSDTGSVQTEEEKLRAAMESLAPIQLRKNASPSFKSSPRRRSRSSSLNVISEVDVEAEHPSALESKTQMESSPQKVTPPPDEGIGSSIMSFFSSAINDLRIDNILEGGMETVAKFVEEGYKEVENMATTYYTYSSPDMSGRIEEQRSRQRRSPRSRAAERRRRAAAAAAAAGGYDNPVGPFKVEISRSFKPEIIGVVGGDDCNGTVTSKVSALTYEEMSTGSPARMGMHSTRIAMSYSEDTDALPPERDTTFDLRFFA